jgi:SOS-response transcriptional repressor|nr:MAG TPA: SOS-response transcriptional repressors (RecA-mediated autopeptidases) [Caudoviricetes sp.]
MKNIGAIIRDLREAKGMTQEELANKVGYTSRAAINKIESGANKLKQEKIQIFAEVLGCSVNELLGIEETTQQYIRKIALYDSISCGTGGFVDDNIIDYVSLPAEMFSSKKEYFAQYAHGDSMINANINDGDLVIFEKTSSVTNGMIGCFCVDDNIATCKRLSMTNGQIILLPENPSYNPIIANVETFKCIGKLAFVINDRRDEEDK